MSQNQIKRYFVFIGLLFNISLGLLWTYGNLSPYIASYITYHKSSCTLHNYDYYSSIMNYSFFLLFTCLTFGVIIGGKIELRFGPTISILISSLFVSIGFGSTYFALSLNNIYLILFSYGILFGFGVGLGYSVLIIVLMRWFPNNQGTVCGISSAVFGGSPLIWDFIQETLVNPNNYKMDDMVGYCKQKNVIHHIPNMFAYIAIIAILMQFISLFAVKNPLWYIPENNKGRKASLQQIKYEQHSLTVYQSIRTTTFWMFWINNFLYSYCLMFITAEWKEFAIQYLKIDSDSYLSFIGSMAALFNGIGRFSWGFLYDYNKSFKISMGLQTFIVGLFITTLPLLSYINFMNLISIKILFAIWICIINICIGCQYAFLPTCIATTFGTKYTGSIVGLFVWCEAPCSLLVVIVTQYKHQLFNGWSYYTIFVGICSFVSTILSLLTNENLNRQKIIESYQQNANFYQKLATNNNSNNMEAEEELQQTEAENEPNDDASNMDENNNAEIDSELIRTCLLQNDSESIDDHSKSKG